mgnify:CR=1 FL=1
MSYTHRLIRTLTVAAALAAALAPAPAAAKESFEDFADI